MKLVASLKFISSKDCIGVISSSVLENINQTHDIHTFRISSGQHFAFISLLTSASQDFGANWLCISGLYASKLGFNDGCNILLEPAEPLGCARAWIAPVSVDDWEILELHAGVVERQTLNQIRIIWPGQIFPVWINKNICVFLKTVQIEPSSECSLLMPLSELIIEPKTNKSISNQNCAKLSSSSKIQEETSDSRNKNFSKILSKVENSPDHTSTSNENVRSTSANFVIKSKSVLSVIHIRFFKQIFSAFKFLFFFLLRAIPQFVWHFLRLRYPFAKPKTLQRSLQLQHDWVNNQINNLPHDFMMIARVEPVLFEQSSLDQHCQLLINQPNTIFLHSTADMKNCQPDVYLVLMSKFFSPYEKLSENKLKKTKTVFENNLPSEDKKKCLSQCIVRMYLHPQSKHAMEKNWKIVCESHCIKVPACVRRQMNLSVSSKVFLQKLSDKPLFVNDIAGITLDIVSSLKLSDVSNSLLIDSFREWISGISDDNNPVPVFVGSLFIFSIVLNNKTVNYEPVVIVVEAVIDFIEVKNKKAIDKFKINEKTFFLSGNDFAHINIKVVKSNQPSFIPLQNDVDLELPSESLSVYSQGFEAEVKTLQSFIDLALSFRPLSAALSDGGNRLRQTCVLITGAKNTGKTVLSRSLLNEFASDNLHAYVHSIACSKWRGKKPESVKKLCNELLYELVWRQPSILLLDDLDQLIPASINNEEENTPDNLYTLQLVSVIKPLFQALAGGLPEILNKVPKVAVLITAKSKHALHPSLTCSGSHLFGSTVNIELPNFEKRKAMFLSLVQNFTDLHCPYDINEIIHKTEGFAVGDLTNLVRKSSYLVKQNNVVNQFISKAESSHDELHLDIINKAMTSITPASLQSAKLHKPVHLNWKDVGGLSIIKQKLQEQLLWPVKYKHIFAECGLQPQSGVLLFGPPGCGKTLLASVVASECGLNFISIKGPEVLSKYIGASEAAVRDLFSRAKAASPCVLFFDEFDSLAPKRGHDSTGVTDRVVNQLLTHLDGVEPLVGVTVMAATSRPDLLDPALLRPGRLDNLLYCPFPSAKDRLDILKALSVKLYLNESVNLDQLARDCENFSGADLKALLYNAQLEAVHEKMNFKSHLPTERDLSLSAISSVSSNPKLDDTLHRNEHSYDAFDMEENLNLSSIDGFKVSADDQMNSIKSDSNKETLKSHSELDLSVSGCAASASEACCSDDVPDVEAFASQVVYFSSLHQGRATSIPSAVLQATESLFVRPHDRSSVAEDKTNSEFLLISNRHLDAALKVTRPSVSIVERQNFDLLYSNFVRSRDRSDSAQKNYFSDKLRTTLS